MVETEKMEMVKNDSNGPGERPSDANAGQMPRGSGGMRGGRGGGMRPGGRPGGRGMNISEPLNYTVELKLENAPKNSN